jgi:hypothetical protein
MKASILPIFITTRLHATACHFQSTHSNPPPACILPLSPKSHPPTHHYRLATESHVVAPHNCESNQIIAQSLISPGRNEVMISRWRVVLLSKYKYCIITWQQAKSVFFQGSRPALGSTYRWSKGKAFPLHACSGPEVSRKLRFPDFFTTAQNGGKVVSLTHRPHLPPGNTPGTHFC